MKRNRTYETEDIVQEISKLRGRNRAAQGGLLWLARGAANVDQALLHRSQQIRRRLMRALDKALPKASPHLIAGVAADLESLWEYGQKLDKELSALSRMRMPKHREDMRKMLIKIEVEQGEYARLCIQRLQRRLPELREDLEHQSLTAKRKDAKRRVAKRSTPPKRTP